VKLLVSVAKRLKLELDKTFLELSSAKEVIKFLQEEGNLKSKLDRKVQMDINQIRMRGLYK
jgi:ribosomal protein S13